MKKGFLLLCISFFVVSFSLNSCSKDVSGTDPHLLDDPQLGVGKWKIKKPRTGVSFSKGNEGCAITEIIFRSDGVFKIYFGTTFIQGNFEITNETTIELTQESSEVGQMTNVVITDGNISFSIQLIDICSDTLEGEKDETYNESLCFIPDDGFEQGLIDLGIDDTLDDYVPISAIDGITEINLNGRGIQNLAGIEEFRSLEELIAYDNEIENLNVRSLSNLISIDLHNNRLSGHIDLSNMSSLRFVSLSCNNSCSPNNSNGEGIEGLNITGSNNLVLLNVASNDIGFLDLGEKAALEELNINDNSFNGLFIANNTALTWLDASGNPNLVCVIANAEQINRPVDCENAPNDASFWCYDPIITVLTEDCDEYQSARVDILDPNFEQGLIDRGIDDIIDGGVLLSNVLNTTELELSSRGIEDITGISSFGNLRFLDLHGNSINVIPELPSGIVDLRIAENCYTTLDVSNLLSLRTLHVGSCLESLDISMLTLLEEFDVFSGSPALACVRVNETQYNKTIQCELPNEYVWCYDPVYTVFTTNDCDTYFNAKTYVPDDAFEAYLIERGVDDQMDDYVFTHKLRGVDYLDMNDRGVQNLEGIADFPNLRALNVNNNEISGEVNLNHNPLLEYVDIARNPVNALILSDHPNLFQIYAYATNSMEVLEIGNSPLLRGLSIHDAFITEINLSRFPLLESFRAWNNSFTQIDFTQNPALTEIWVDGLEMTFLDLSNNPLLTRLTVGESNITGVDISNSTLLTHINLGGNFLTSLDLSNASLLERLIVNKGQLTSIDLSNNTNIYELDLSDNQLSSIDLSGFNALNRINLNGNTAPFSLTPPPAGNTLVSLDIAALHLESFNFEDYPNLGYIFASDNRFSEVNLTNLDRLNYLNLENNGVLTSLLLNENAPLTHISVYGNQLNSLDVSSFSDLNVLLLDNNQLGSLDISSISQLFFFSATNNPSLQCIQVNENQLANPLDCNQQEVTSFEEIRRWCIDSDQFYALKCD